MFEQMLQAASTGAVPIWKHKLKVPSRKPRISPEAIHLIKEMAAHNRLWGAGTDEDEHES